MPLNSPEAQLLRHDVEDERRIGAKPRFPAKPEPRTRRHDPLEKWPRFLGWLMERDCLTSCHQMDFSSSLIQESRDIDGRCPRSDHSNFASLEDTEIVMLGAVAHKLCRQAGKEWREVAEVGDASGDDDLACGHRLSFGGK